MADIYDLFMHNWISGVSMETAWMTSVDVSAEMAEMQQAMTNAVTALAVLRAKLGL